jgi:hypothetical protein
MTKKGIVMKQRYLLFRRAGVFYYEDTTTGKQLSLRTKDEAEALTFLACWRGWSRRINARPVVASNVKATGAARSAPDADFRVCPPRTHICADWLRKTLGGGGGARITPLGGGLVVGLVCSWIQPVGFGVVGCELNR